MMLLSIGIGFLIDLTKKMNNRYWWLHRKRQTMRLRINERRFISGVVFYIPLEGLSPMASDGPVPQDPGSPVHHIALAVP